MRSPSRPVLRQAVLSAVLAALCACGGSGGPRSVTVSDIDDLWGADGRSTKVPAGVVRAVTLSPADGSPPLTATEASPSVWVVKGVPAGPYLLEATWYDGSRLRLESSADTVDLGSDGMLNRFGYGAPDYVPFSLSGLTPWEPAAHELVLYSYESALWEPIAAQLAGGATGGVGAVGVAVSPSGNALNLRIEPTDTLYGLQRRRAEVGTAGDVATTVVAAARATGGWIPDTRQSAGAWLPPLAFAPPRATGVVAADLRGAAFAAALPGPLDLAGFGVGVSAVPNLHAEGGGMPLLSITAPGGAPLEDRDDGLITYGRVAPAGWREIFSAGYGGYQDRYAPGATKPYRAYFNAVVSTPVEAAPSPVAPAISAVRDVTVAGRDAMTPQDGVGTGPLIAWSAPAVGVPTSAIVLVRALVPNANYSTEILLRFVTTGSSVQIPEGTLQAGKGYVATITVRSSPSDRPATAPYRQLPPYAAARIATQVFTP